MRPTWTEAYELCLPTIKAQAKKFAQKTHNGLEREDLINIGLFGLMEALKKYDPSRNNNFIAYALHRIKGSMLDEIRKNNWVPRSASDRLKLYLVKKEELKKNGVHPNHEELKKAINLTDKQIIETERIQNIKVVSFNGVEGLQIFRPTLVEEKMESKQTMKSIEEAIQSLPEQMRNVLTMRLIEDLTLEEVAKRLNLSEARISQIHNKGIGFLRKKLETLNLERKAS